MRYERGNVIIAVHQLDGFGKNPSLWIGTNDPNTLYKVASFRNADTAQQFCKWFEYMIGVSPEPKEADANDT